MFNFKKTGKYVGINPVYNVYYNNILLGSTWKHKEDLNWWSYKDVTGELVAYWGRTRNHAAKNLKFFYDKENQK